MEITSLDLINKTQKTIMDDASRYFEPAMSLTSIGAWVKKDYAGSILESQVLRNFLIGSLQSLPQSTLFMASDEHGNFVSVAPLPEKRVFSYIPDKPLPHGSTFVLEVISNSGPTYVEYRAYLDKDGHELDREYRPSIPKELQYDNRERDWYIRTKKLKKPNWSDIYPDWFARRFTLTASTPIFDSEGNFYGAISCDISIESISYLLARQKASRSGLNFILNKSGELVAFPDYEKIFISDDSNQNDKSITNIRLAKITDLHEEGNLAKAYEIYHSKKTPQFTYIYDDIEYIAYFSNFIGNFSQGWILGMIAPSDDFVGPIRETSRDVMLISIFILILATIVLVIFSHKISYPIETLAVQMRRIRDLDIEHEEMSKSSLEEIADIEEALSLMKEGLASFSKFVPKALVRSLIQSGVEAKLGGERRNLAIMFTDIESFTSISESMDSDSLMNHLSDYLSAMSGIILDHKGTIDKYIGDAIMAFWGAPEEDSRLVINACQAALTCSRRLKILNEDWTKKGKVPFPTRFGLHYGEVIVGNVGSDDRMNYTVIGDSVNLASRLEGANKIYKTEIIVSESVHQEIMDLYLCRPLDIVAVKGREKGIRIYELIAKLSDDPDFAATALEREWSQLTQYAFQSYLNQNWDDAIKLYKEVLEKKSGDPVAKMYIERCEYFKKSPPARDWDGVFHLTTK
tara:strand:- start:291 stop:2354 length:2064 start_codon:yes stop_codon:yes gene_type:complete